MKTKVSLLVVTVIVLWMLNIYCGYIHIPMDEVTQILMGSDSSKESWKYILLESRLPQSITAFFTGASLAVAGLLLQTAFRNPLAGPSILGIDAGANLGVALVMLLCGGSIMAGDMLFSGYLLVIIAALLGSFGVMSVLLFLSHWLHNNLMLLIAGVLMGYLTSSAISMLNFLSSADNVFSYMVWGMGSFTGVTWSRLPFFVLLCSGTLLGSMALIKPLNILQMGDMYAQNLGVNLRLTYRILLVLTAVLVAVCTAFCGPISFIGLAVPHLVKLYFRTSDHRILLPFTLLIGGGFALLCNLLCALLGGVRLLPINVITPFLGVPVVLYVILAHTPHRK